jgi:hypothetical protein
MSADDDLPVVVYTGDYTDAMFLASLLEGSGIPATFVQSRHSAAPDIVVIARRDVAAAMPLIEDFKSGGGSTLPQRLR